MIANPSIPYPAGIPRPFTLNDLRVHPSVPEAPSSTSALTLSGLAMAVVLAIGAFIWLDPLRLFTPTQASPQAPAFVPSAEPARQIERQEVIAPLTPPPTPVPAPKSVDLPIARAPVVQAPIVSAPVVRPRVATIKPEARGNPIVKANKAVPEASPKEKPAPPVLLTKPEDEAAPPVLLSNPEEKPDAPIVPKLGDDTGNAPKPAGTNDPAPPTE